MQGVFITPPDGLVYYTSDKSYFLYGAGKTKGHYLYYDSNMDAFYETVFILSPDDDGDGIYTVMSIGYNYDGKHEFLPYQILDEEEPVGVDYVSKNFLDTNAYDGKMYHANIDSMEEFMEKHHFDLPEVDNMVPRDQIFDIFRLLPIEEMNAYAPGLFYDVYLQIYGDTWMAYKDGMKEEIINQVVTMGVAGLASSAATLTAALLGLSSTGWGAVIAGFTFAIVYFVETIWVSNKKKEIQKERTASQIYLPLDFKGVPISKPAPKKLSDKYSKEIYTLWQHHQGSPNAKYLPVGDNDGLLTAQAIVSPPKSLRFTGSKSDYANSPFYSELMIASRLEMASELGIEIDEEDIEEIGDVSLLGIMPSKYDRVFEALDKARSAYTNLDYFLISSELPAYNGMEFYGFAPYEDTTRTQVYSKYPHNTLGFLESAVGAVSENKYDAIRPYCVNGRPAYVFIDSTDDRYSLTQPATSLYQPIVVSSHRYNELLEEGINTGGVVSVVAKTGIYGKKLESVIPSGIDINSTNLDQSELGQGFKVKIPLLSKSFGYPITKITIDILRDIYTMSEEELNEIEFSLSDPNSWYGEFASELEVDSQDYTIVDGTLYFYISLDEFVLSHYSKLKLMMAGVCSYRVNIHIQTVVPDTNTVFSSVAYFDTDGTTINKQVSADIYYLETQGINAQNVVLDTTTNEYARVTLTQSTSYMVADYFNVFTLASELAKSQVEEDFTKAVTMISTLYSTLIMLPLMAITAGATSYLQGLNKIAAQEIAKKMGEETGQILTKEMVKHTAKMTVLKSLAVGIVNIPRQVITETFEELYIDPAIESYMYKLGNTFGWSDGVSEFWGMFVTSFREAFMGAAKGFIEGSQGGSPNVDPNIVSNAKNSVDIVQDANMEATQQSSFRTKLDQITQTKAYGLGKRMVNLVKLIPSFTVGGGGLASMTFFSELTTDILFESRIENYFNNKIKQFMVGELAKHVVETKNMEFLQNKDKAIGVKLATQTPNPMNPVSSLVSSNQLQGQVDAYSDVYMKQKQEKIEINQFKIEELKVNSESDSNENSFEKLINEFRQKGEGSFLVFVEGLSMYPLFEPGSRVPVKLMPKGTEYEVGDIIVFKSFDSYIIHAVIDSYVYKGKTYYVTGGLNQETNPYVDCTTISSDHILGLADLSEEFLAGIPALESQGLLFEMKAYGMINQFDTLLQRAQEVHERIANIDQNNKEAVVDVLLDYMELIIEFKRTNTDHLDIRSQFIQASIEADFLASYLHIVNNIFTGYSSDLFKQMFGRILGNVIDPNNQRAIRGDLNEAFDKLKILTEIIVCIDNFNRYDKAISKLLNYDTVKKQKDPTIFVDQLTDTFWEKSYTQLLRESVDYEQFLDDQLVNDIFLKYGYEIDLNELLGITKPLQILDRSGNMITKFDPVWIGIGQEDYNTPHRGYEFEHIIQEHKNDFKQWGYTDNKEILKLIFNTISQKTGIHYRTRTWVDPTTGASIITNFIGFKIVDKYGRVQFLTIMIRENDNNRIYSAYPTWNNPDLPYNPYEDLINIFKSLGI